MELFVKYGGMQFWTHFIDTFYDKVTRDSVLRDIFVNRNVRRIKEMQLSLLEMTLTGGQFPEEVMVQVHRNLEIDETQFARFIGVYKQTLVDLGVETADAEMMRDLLAGYKSQVAPGESLNSYIASSISLIYFRKFGIFSDSRIGLLSSSVEMATFSDGTVIRFSLSEKCGFFSIEVRVSGDWRNPCASSPKVSLTGSLKNAIDEAALRSNSRLGDSRCPLFGKIPVFLPILLNLEDRLTLILGAFPSSFSSWSSVYSLHRPDASLIVSVDSTYCRLFKLAMIRSLILWERWKKTVLASASGLSLAGLMKARPVAIPLNPPRNSSPPVLTSAMSSLS